MGHFDEMFLFGSYVKHFQSTKIEGLCFCINVVVFHMDALIHQLTSYPVNLWTCLDNQFTFIVSLKIGLKQFWRKASTCSYLWP